ncbi:MAG TPA: hypothetical protein VH134_10835 [Candidatus Dormibacteraeota bacterium]|nr:hypothetical protein [Candidatus Dormibacteraeota bacterium]
MKRTGLIGTAGAIVAAGLLTGPLSVAAESAPSLPAGSAQASAAQVSLSPSALLTAAPAVNGLLHHLLSTAGSASGGDLLVRLASTQASGQLLAAPAADLQQGHAESTALDVDLAPLSDQLGALQGALNGALATLRTVQLPGAGPLSPGAITQGSGLLGGLLGGNPLAGALPPQLSSLASSLTQVQSLLGGITGDTGPGGVLHGLDPRLTETVSARYNVPGQPNAPVADASLADINLPAGGPLALRLTPFHARAVNSALAAVNHIDAAQSSADNEVSSLDLTPKLALPGAGSLASLASLQSAVTGLLNPQTGLPAVQSLLGGATGPAGGLGAVQGLTSSLGVLSPLLGPDSLVGTLLGGGLSLTSLVRASDVASTATVQPSGSGGVRALSSTRLADLQVLPLGASVLRGVLGSLPADAAAGLTQRLGSLADLPLLDIKGVNSSAQTALGPGTTSPQGTAGFAEIDVLGAPVAGAADALALEPGSQKRIAIPGTGLGLVVSRGVPSIGFDTPEHRSVSVTGLDVRLVGDGAGPLGDLLGGGSAGTATAGQPIAAVTLASSAAQIASTPTTGLAATAGTAVITAAQGPISPSTGLFGGPALLAVAALGAAALSMQAVPRLAVRRRPVVRETT